MSLLSLPLGTLLPGSGITSPTSAPAATSTSPSSFNPFTAMGAANPTNFPTVDSVKAFFSGNIARVVTGLLGVLLIAAAIFTHPTVINVGKKIGKATGEAAIAA